MALGDFYKGLEDKYYAFMDSLDAKGIPVYKVIDPLDNAGIPSFPVFVLIILIILGIIGWFLFGMISNGGETTSITVNVVDADGAAIDGAQIKIDNAGASQNTSTNSEGKAIIDNVKLNDSISIIVSKQGYADKSQTLSVTQKNEVFDVILSIAGNKSVAVKFKKKATSELVTDSLTIDFSCSGNLSYAKQKTTTTGEASLDDVPNDCGTLYADVRNFECENNCAVDLEAGDLVFYLNEKQVQGNGKITVTVKDEQQNLLAGIEVIARQENDYTDYESCDTTTLGTCELDALPFGKYYLIANDLTGMLARYNSSALVPAQFVELKSDQSSFDYTIAMKKADNTKKVSLKIIDQLGAPIKDAEVSLFKALDKIDSKFSGTDGKIEFVAADNGPFNASVVKAGYLNKSVDNIAPGQAIDIALVPATADNANRIAAAIVDEKAKPVENAKIYLRNAATLTNVGNYIVSGADGKAQFESVEEGAYVVFAEKTGFDGKSSAIISVKNGVPVNETRIALSIGFGSIKLSAKNEDDSPVSGASIKVNDYCNNSVLEELASNTAGDGTKTIEVRVDKCVYFEVSASGYLNYTTNIIQPVKGVTTEKSIVLVKSIDSLKSTFALYSGNQIVSGTALERGKQYTAKISLLVPEGTAFDEVGLHFRTGASNDGITNVLEKDALYISSIAAGSAKLLKGTSFTPLKGYDVDAKKLTSGNAKWFNAVFAKPKPGVYEIIANIQVTQNAGSGALLDIYNRAWAKQGANYLRNPVDGVLASSESNAQKQSLYANAARNVYTIGNSSLCSEGFCYTFTLTDKTSSLTQSIIDSAPIKIGNNYSFNFSLINNSSQADGAEIAFSNNANGLKLLQYEITDVDAKKLTGTISGSKQTVAVGDMLKGAAVLGRIDFSALKEGINSLEFKLNAQSAGGKQSVFARTFKFEAAPSQQMNLEILPQLIVPFIENELIIKAADDAGNALEEAVISIKKNGEQVVSGKTNSEGIFSFSLEAVREGTVLEFSAQKAGYKKQTKTINVMQQIISVTPTSINETFKASVDQTIRRDLQLRNLTNIPLKIGLLDLTTNFDGLVQLNYEKDYVGREIVKEVDDNIVIALKLSPKGRNVSKITTTNAVLNIHFVSNELQRTWVTSIPITITIGLGNEVDLANCLEVDQEAISIASGGESVQKNILLSNKCTVDGSPIELKNIEARIKQGAANKIGELVLRSSIEEDTLNLADEKIQLASNLTLTEKFKTIASGIGKDKESALTLTFNPDKLDSAVSIYALELRAHNPTAKGDQIILAKTNLNLTVNDLLACVKVTQRAPLQLQLSPFNTGYGLYNNQFGYNPAQGFGAFSSSTQPSYGSTYNNPSVVFPNQFSGNYDNYYQGVQYRNNPSSYLNQQFGAGGYTDPRFNNQLNSNIANTEGKFNVENSCSLPVEIRLNADAGVAAEPTGMDLTPNQNQDVKVKSTFMIGSYNVEIKAKVKNSSDKQITVDKLTATVEPNDSYRNWRDCISLDRQIYSFNDLIAKPVEGIITNTCYSSGVILDPSNPVEFDIQNIYSGTTSNVFTDNLIQRTEVIDRTIKPSADGKVIEQVRFRLRKSIDYRTGFAQNQLPTQANPVVQIYNWRVALTGAYYEIRAPQSAYINFRTRTGNAQRLIYDVIIEDFWNIAGIVGPGTTNLEDYLGTKEATFDCIRDIDWSKEFPNGIPSTRFKNGIFELEADPSVMILDSDHCGTADHLKNLSPKRFEDKDSGLIISFSLIDNDHNVKLKFDNRNMKSDAGIDTALDADLYRYRLNKSKPVAIGVKGEVKIPSNISAGAQKEIEQGVQAGKNKAQICPSIESKYNITKEECENLIDELSKEFSTCTGDYSTGAIAFENYGFDKLLFSWEQSQIKFNSCDAATDAVGAEELQGKYFCDAVQYSISLNEKAKAIKDFLGDASNKAKDQFKIDDTTDTKTQQDFKNTDNLWRFTKTQALVKDNAANENLLFFINENGIMENENAKLAATDQVRTLLGYFNDASLNQTQVNQIAIDMKAILQSIKDTPSSARNGKDIAGEIDISNSKWTTENKATLSSIGGEQLGNLSNKNILTFNEFKAFHDAITGNTNCDSPATSCTIALNGNSSIAINIDFLKALYSSIKFKIGLRNIEGLTAEEMNEIIEKAPDVAGLNWPNGITNYTEFKKNYLDFGSFFVLDGYSNDFKNDFVSKYSNADMVLDPANWNIKIHGNSENTSVVEAGKSIVNLNYNWDPIKPVITVNINNDFSNGATDLKTLNASYADNYLFYLPFDGAVGAGGREGYGSSIAANNADNVFVNNDVKELGSDSGSAVKKFNSSETDYHNGKFSKTKDGTVLEIDTSISPKKFHYYPSIPYAIVTQITGSSGNDALFYSLEHTSNGKKEIGVEEKLEGTDYVFAWNSSCNDTKLIKDQKESLNAYCPGNNSQHYGLITDIQNLATKGYGTIAYIPHTEIFTLNLLCSKEKATTFVNKFDPIKPFDSQKNSKKFETKSFSLTGDTAENNYDRTIQKFVEQINSNDICVKTSAKNFILKWNEQQIFESLKDVCSQATIQQQR